MFSKKGFVIICFVILSALLITGCLPTTTVTTPEEYFTFYSATGTITGYDIAGGLDVVIPSTIGGIGVAQIGDNAFYDKDLTSVIIPDSVTVIWAYAFYGNQLTSVTIPDSIWGIDDYAFANNQLTSVTIPDSMTGFGDYAFANNQLTSVTIGNSVTGFGTYAFANNQLTSVTIPDSVTGFGNAAFAGNELTSVTIGAGVDINNDSTTMGTNTGFKAVYDGGGKLAGTYNYTGGVWVKA